MDEAPELEQTAEPGVDELSELEQTAEAGSEDLVKREQTAESGDVTELAQNEPADDGEIKFGAGLEVHDDVYEIKEVTDQSDVEPVSATLADCNELMREIKHKTELIENAFSDELTEIKVEHETTDVEAVIETEGSCEPDECNEPNDVIETVESMEICDVMGGNNHKDIPNETVSLADVAIRPEVISYFEKIEKEFGINKKKVSFGPGVKYADVDDENDDDDDDDEEDDDEEVEHRLGEVDQDLEEIERDPDIRRR